jgi:D-glycero-D-manno-heptose 1,7-bisphosphate phosphatase
LSRLVILGRDGVINHDLGHAITNVQDWMPIPGSLEAIARLSQAGFRVAIATNQPGLAEGLLDLDVLNAIHHKLHDQLDRLGGHVVAIAFCPHAADDDCACRRPETGLFQQLAERFGVPLDSVIIVGTRHADVAAAASVGAQPMLIRDDSGAHTDHDLGHDPVPCFDNLAQLANALLVEE